MLYQYILTLHLLSVSFCQAETYLDILETYREEQCCLNVPKIVEALESYHNSPGGEERDNQQVGKHIFTNT